MGIEKGPGKFAALCEQLKSGELNRRDFTTRAIALGVGMPVISFLLKANDVSAGRLRPAGGFAVVAAQTEAAAPAVGMEGVTRGEGGELRLIQWQATTQLSPHVSTGTKDYLGASLVLEPLLHYLPDGSLIPHLAAEVPTIENGLLSEDLMSVTFNLPDGIVWSDGEAFTAEDVAFTWQWIMDPANASVSSGVWGTIDNIEVADPLTAIVTYAEPNANWFEPFTGDTWGPIYPMHILSEGPEAHTAFINAPIGTGPYVVTSFAPNDQVLYAANENYREANKPYFATVNLKGGGDAVSAARAVLQTGDYDYAWNLQVEPTILRQLEEGGAGTLIVVQGTSLERVHFNFSDPNAEVDGQRSEMNTPHPFLTDLAVRTALNLAADRAAIANQFYQGEEFEPPTANVLNGIPAMASPNTEWAFDLEAAAQALEDAGWVMTGDVRAKDGVELRMNYATSINEVRQKTQQVLKSAFEQIGFRVQLLQIDSGIYFDGSAGNEQNIGHFYYDMAMWTNNATSPFPVAFFTSWYAGPDGENIAQASNQWSGQNYQRYTNAEYDEIFEAVQLETDLEAAAQMFIALNDIVIEDAVILPLVNRAAGVYAISNTLENENISIGPFSGDYWNIANWVRVSE
ncbi:MAG: peptide ABC transporter substrate-binding protein [Chloroflexota bacterium]|nr:peptide ABC transporter substrate-binding protein [Chloroflexota bacterium]